MRGAALLTLILLAGTAHADDTKSSALALGIPIGATVGGVLLFAMASDGEGTGGEVLTAAALMLTGPSWGHVYTGDIDLAIGGTLLRVVGLAMIQQGAGDCVPSDLDIDDSCNYENKTPALTAAGTVLLVGTALAEIVDAPFAARRYNRDHATTLTPTVTKSGYGVALVGQF